MIKIHHLIGLILFTLAVIQSEAKAIETVSSEPLVIAQKITLNSQVLKQHRDIYVSLPRGYDVESTHYPVLFVMDGDFFIKMADYLTKNLSISHQIEDMIVVAVSQKNRHQELKQPGANNFLQFISTEVFDYVSSNYRASDFKMLYGHSLGGSFALYSMMEDPKLFEAYIAISPVLNKQGTPDLEALKLSISDSNKHPNYLFLSKGNEQENYQKTIPDLAAFLQEKIKDKFRWSYREYPSKTHATVPSIALEDSLADFFAGRIMPAMGELTKFDSMKDIEGIGGYAHIKEYYQSYHQKLGHDFGVPYIVYSRFAWTYFNNNEHQLLAQLVNKEGKGMEEVNFYLASSYLYNKDYNRAINLIKSDLKLNPKHFRGWYNLAVAYRDSGKVDDAKKAMTRAIDLTKNSQLLEKYQKEYKQLSEMNL